MSQIAIIISQEELTRMIDAAVDTRIAKLQVQISAAKELPVRLKVKDAAKQLSMSVATFDRKYSHLKQYDRNGVFVFSADLISLKK